MCPVSTADICPVSTEDIYLAVSYTRANFDIGSNVHTGCSFWNGYLQLSMGLRRALYHRKDEVWWAKMSHLDTVALEQESQRESQLSKRLTFFQGDATLATDFPDIQTAINASTQNSLERDVKKSCKYDASLIRGTHPCAEVTQNRRSDRFGITYPLLL